MPNLSVNCNSSVAMVQPGFDVAEIKMAADVGKKICTHLIPVRGETHALDMNSINPILDVEPSEQHQIWRISISARNVCNGRYRMVSIFDEHSETALGVCLATKIGSDSIASMYGELVKKYGAPQYIRLNVEA